VIPANKRVDLKLRRALKALRWRSVSRNEMRGPVFLLELAEEGHRRLSSRRRGRPTALEWDIRRLIPFSRTDWERLSFLGAKIGLSPAQLATLLVEKGLKRLLTERGMGRPASTQRPSDSSDSRLLFRAVSGCAHRRKADDVSSKPNGCPSSQRFRR
jgi:hypothetical protein